MIDVAEMISSRMLLESRKYGPCRHVFDDGTMTFANIRDMFQNALNINVCSVTDINECEADIPTITLNPNKIFPKYKPDSLNRRLEKFIDGLGWKCTLDQYVQDRYSRYIVNKAREYGIDVSRMSDFVRCLAARLSRISTQRPTRADLRTYAKLDNVRTRCDEYRQFIDDLELDSDKTNIDIIHPVEEFVLGLCLKLMKSIYGIILFDQSSGACRIADQFDTRSFHPTDYDRTRDGIRKFKRDFHALCDYVQALPPDGVVFRHNGKTYRISGDFGCLSDICRLIGGMRV